MSADEVGRPACGGRLGVAQGLVKGSIVLNIGTLLINTSMQRVTFTQIGHSWSNVIFNTKCIN